MPAIVGLLALCILVLLVYVLGNQNKTSKTVLDDQNKHDQLALQVDQLQKTIQQLEKRLHNVETIVTDTQFVDPPTNGREAINLQAEIADLKKIIQKLR